jgi:hypothetical protein
MSSCIGIMLSTTYRLLLQSDSCVLSFISAKGLADATPLGNNFFPDAEREHSHLCPAAPCTLSEAVIGALRPFVQE